MALAERSTRRRFSWRAIGWGTAALLLLLPLVAMRFTAEVNWTGLDFLFMGILLGGIGLAFEFIVRKSGSTACRVAAGIALLAAFLTIWVNAAVGMIGSPGNPLNLLFAGVLLIALSGAILVRLEPGGMTWAMLAAAVAQAVAGAVGLSIDPRGAVLSIGFALVWLLASALFWNATRKQT